MRFRFSKSRLEAQNADEPVEVRAAGAPEGHYLTDGRRLYRVVSHLYPARRGRQVGLLEDCLTLELAPYSPAEYRAMRPVSLRGPVRAA
jgi:hypothetical protein